MNAIILAAGMGTRLRPLTNDIPKCLVSVNGKPMVEWQIQFLHEIGIDDITLVSGYKAEQLDYLIEKYNVRIVFNEKYDTCNNIYSLYKVKDIFGDTYILEGDVYIHNNCLKKQVDRSAYFAVCKENYTNEWGLVVDESRKLVDIKPGNGSGFIMSGISFWTATDAAQITKELQRIINMEDYTELFWDNILLATHSQYEILVNPVDCIYEIDTVQDLMEVERQISCR